MAQHRTDPLARPQAVVAAATVLLAGLPWWWSPSAIVSAFSESGPFETVSAAAWAAAGFAALLLVPRARLLGMSYALVLFALALRETGLPRDVVPSGRALLRLSYYLDPAQPLGQRIVFAFIIAALLASLVHAGTVTLASLLRKRPSPIADLPTLVLAGGVLVASQIAERLQDFAGGPGHAALALLALEEGLECVSPLLVLFAMARTQCDSHLRQTGAAGALARACRTLASPGRT